MIHHRHDVMYVILIKKIFLSNPQNSFSFHLKRGTDPNHKLNILSAGACLSKTASCRQLCEFILNIAAQFVCLDVLGNEVVFLDRELYTRNRKKNYLNKLMTVEF